MVGEELAGSRLVAMVQHPWCIFAYWEFWEKDREALERVFNARFETLPFVLRVYRLGEAGAAEKDVYEAITVNVLSGKHYVYPVSPGRLYWLELGVAAGSGGYTRLLRSDIVETPPASPAGELAGEETATYSPFMGL